MHICLEVGLCLSSKLHISAENSAVNINFGISLGRLIVQQLGILFLVLFQIHGSGFLALENYLGLIGIQGCTFLDIDGRASLNNDATFLVLAKGETLGVAAEISLVCLAYIGNLAEIHGSTNHGALGEINLIRHELCHFCHINSTLNGNGTAAVDWHIGHQLVRSGAVEDIIDLVCSGSKDIYAVLVIAVHLDMLEIFLSRSSYHQLAGIDDAGAADNHSLRAEEIEIAPNGIILNGVDSTCHIDAVLNKVKQGICLRTVFLCLEVKVGNIIRCHIKVLETVQGGIICHLLCVDIGYIIIEVNIAAIASDNIVVNLLSCLCYINKWLHSKGSRHCSIEHLPSCRCRLVGICLDCIVLVLSILCAHDGYLL